MRLGDKSARSLAWFAVFLLLPGVLIMSPTGRIFFIALAAIVALIPVIFGSMKRRIFGGIVVAVCLVIGMPTYFEHRKIYDLHASAPKYSRVVTTWQEVDVPAVSDPATRMVWFSAANRSNNEWHVYMEGGRTRAALAKEAPEPRSARPTFIPTAGQLQNASAFATVDDGWLVGFNQGEFGAALYWFSTDGKQSYKISSHQVVDFFSRPDGIHAIEGLAHLSASEGSVIRIARPKAGSRWQASSVAPLPFAPYAVSAPRDGAALITLSDSLVSFGADRKIQTLLANAPWGALFPSSSVLSPDGQKLYIGMRQFVGEFDLTTKKLRLLIPSKRFLNKLSKEDEDRIREQYRR